MKLYGHPGSASTRKVLMLLGEKSASCELLFVDLASGQQASDAFRQLHPFGKVPVLEHEGQVLYETLAILLYLDQVLGGESLLPDAPLEQARAVQWISVETSYFGAHTLTLLYQEILSPMMGSQPNRDAVHGARQSLGYALDVMERTLAGQAYLASDTFSLADVCMMPGIQVIADAKQGDLLEQRPGVSRWWTEVARRHAWREVLARSQQ